MKNILKFLSFLLVSLISLPVFASEDETGFKIESQEGGNVKFSWNETEKSPYAQIFYSEKTSKSGEYENETDLLEGKTHTVEGLQSNKTYYFMLELYNSEGQKVASSTELNTKIGGDGNSVGFKLSEIEQLSNNKIKLIFSNNLNKKQTKEDLNFKIEELNNPSNFFEIQDFEIDSEKTNELILTLNSDVEESKDYKVVSISVLDENGNNIEYGVDSEAVFTGKNIDLNSAGPIKEDPKDIEKKVEVTITKDTTPKDMGDKSGVSAKDLTEKDIKKDVNKTAKEKEELPNTGPEHLILLFLALIIGAAVFVPKYSK